MASYPGILSCILELWRVGWGGWATYLELPLATSNSAVQTTQLGGVLGKLLIDNMFDAPGWHPQQSFS